MKLSQEQIKAAKLDVTEVTSKLEDLTVCLERHCGEDVSQLFIHAVKRSIDDNNNFDSDKAQRLFSESLNENHLPKRARPDASIAGVF